MTSKKEDLAKVSVDAEIVDQTKGPKVKILHFKNKTRHAVRQGHRQRHTVVKITGIK